MSYKEAFKDNTQHVRDFGKEFIKDKSLLPNNKPFIVKDRPRNQKCGISDVNSRKRTQNAQREYSVNKTTANNNSYGLEKMNSMGRDSSSKRMPGINNKKDFIQADHVNQKETNTNLPPPAEKKNFNENRLGNSKHLLVKTFNRYIMNPNSLRNNCNDLVMLHRNFNDIDKVYQLYKSGLESFGKNNKNRRTLKFKSYMGDINDELSTPQDRGYYYKMPNSISKILHYVFRDNGFLETNSKNWTILWNVGSPKTEVFNVMQSWQKINHFPRACEITRKDS